MATESELRDLVQRLRAENEQLQAAAGAGAADAGSAGPPAVDSGPGRPSECVLYIPRERKCPFFRGTSGIPIEDWVDEVRATLRTRRLSLVDQAYFIVDHLEGEARDEVRYRTRTEREDPEKILTILQELYGCSRSYVSLQQSFFSRRQQEGESLQEFSHALCCLMERVERCAPRKMADAPNLLRDQFVEHVLDLNLRRELKKIVREDPASTLLDVRAEALRWEREGRSDEPRERSQSVPSFSAVHYARSGPPNFTANAEMAEIRQLLERQQDQLNKLTQSFLALQVDSRATGRTARPNGVVCLRCQKPGHYARECDNERVIPQPRMPQAMSAAQEVGNFTPLM